MSNEKNTIIIYEDTSGNVELRADIEKDTIWATLSQIADLFDRDKSVISKHIKNIYKEGELDRDSVVAKNATTAKDGKTYMVEYYNLDAILSVGYRVSSKKATLFRIWATGVLREYLKNGYALQRSKLHESPEALEGLDETLTLLKSEKYPGKLKGSITLKVTKKLEPKKK
ncbi:MAG: virulence RhuM family protein [Candidatus Pacebacteria bacterium]|nr:virulence RhuM family protein [Candidatus Paceibacterota bacterium]